MPPVETGALQNPVQHVAKSWRAVTAYPDGQRADIVERAATSVAGYIYLCGQLPIALIVFCKVAESFHRLQAWVVSARHVSGGAAAVA